MKILVLDDELIFRQAVKSWLGDAHTIVSVGTYDEAIKALNEGELDAAIIDIDLKDTRHDGTDFLLQFKKKHPDKPALIQSSSRDVPTVVKCMKLGADDYVEKPVERETLQIRVQKLFSDSQRTRTFRRAFEKSKSAQEIIGRDPSLLKAKEEVENAGESRILFCGETGVGKTPFAWYSNQIVNQMKGQIRPLEQINCASLNKDQFQDQLFGHKKGAFTSAILDKRGLVELANGGDLFLDEIGELPLDVQALFLTFLDSMEYYRLGDDHKRVADVRILCATNRDLQAMVKEGSFRKDLYSRVSQAVVTIPPLRRRGTDIPILIQHFVKMFTGYEKPFDERIIDLFQKYTWEEGNVRELRDAVDYLCKTSYRDQSIRLEHLPMRYRPIDEIPEVLQEEGNKLTPAALAHLHAFGLENYLGNVEKKLLTTCLADSRNDLDGLAKKLRISMPTLYRRIRQYDLPLKTTEGGE